jgi:YVTN family beta-propeller protein
MPDLAPGSTFAGHQIEAVAGRGGMGVVYRATHLALDHVVALKVISPELAADEVFRKRFVAESRAAVSIRHPHVVPIHNAGEEAGLLFVTMDLIEGSDLRELLSDRGALAPEHAIDLLVQLAAALDAAHERGLVHRDIKPGNILIEDRRTGEHVYLTDFGLTKRIGSASGVTATDAFVGTLDYVPPEQVLGERLDACADVYALGCVLYEMLVGKTPFDDREEKVAKIYAHLQDRPPSATDAKPGLPVALDTVIARAMEKDSGLRFQSAGDMARAASAAARGRSLPADTRSVATGLAAPAAVSTTSSGDPATLARNPETADEPVSDSGAAAAESSSDAATVAAAVPGDTLASEHVTAADERAQTKVTGAAGAETRRAFSTKLAGLLAAGTAAAVVLVVLLLGSGGEDGGQAGGGGDGPSVAGDPIAIPGMPVGIAAAEGAVWVASRQGDGVTPINQDSGSPGSEIAVGASPEGVATGSGSVWGAVADEDVVARIDPSTGEVTNIGVGNFPREIAIGAGRAWVTNGRGNSVTPIDLTTEAAGAAIEVGASPHGVTVGEGAVWVTNRVDGTVSKIDPESALVDGEAILVGGNPKGIAVAAEIVWVANTDDASVSMIDPSTDEVVGTLEVGAMPRGVTAAFDSIWVASGSGVVTQIDAEARMVVATIDLTELEPGASPEEIAADKNQLWVTTGEGDSVIRISPG